MKKLSLSLILSAVVLASAPSLFACPDGIAAENRGESTEKRRAILAANNLDELIRTGSEGLAKRAPEVLDLLSQQRKACDIFNREDRFSINTIGHSGEESHKRRIALQEAIGQTERAIRTYTNKYRRGEIEGNIPLSIVQRLLSEKHDQEAAQMLAVDIARVAGLESIAIPAKDADESAFDRETTLPLAGLRALLAEKNDELEAL